MTKRDTGRDSPESPAMREAIKWLQRGDTVRAEEIVLQAARQAGAQSGTRSPAFASAQSDLGTVLLYVGQTKRAVEAFRLACAVDRPEDTQATRDRLTYLMNLGHALERAGELDEAERVLRQGLQGRLNFYGRDHPGYAFGLEPLAELLLRRSKLAEAESAIEECVENFWTNSHPRVASAVAIRAWIYKTSGNETPAFDGLDTLPADLIEDMAETVFQHIDERNPTPVDRQVLQDLLPVVIGRFGEEHALALNTLSWMANIERWLGDHQARIATITRVIGIWDKKGEPARALHALMGLALAQSEAGDHAGAEESYQEAARRVGEIGDPALRSQVLRNHGLFLADRERRPEAEKLLREALTAAESSSADEMVGRSQIALGVFYQHGQQPDSARPLLADALRRLDPAHPDAICARGHLNAIDKGTPCGCGDLGEASADALREFIMQRVPPGLLERLDVKYTEDDWHIEVHLQREPNQEELDQLNRIIAHALEEFRKRAKRLQ